MPTREPTQEELRRLIETGQQPVLSPLAVAGAAAEAAATPEASPAFAAAALERATPAARDAFERQLFSMVYQPIVNLRTGRILAYEALARMQTPHFRNILLLFDAMAECGMAGQLGRVLRRIATRNCQYPLSINLVPSEFAEGWLVRPDDAVFFHRQSVILELTESVPLEYYDRCFDMVEEMRRRALRIAIDDFGSGYSNVKYISDLRPDLVKLDRKLLAGIKPGNRVFRLLRSIVTMVHEMEAKVVAEGIETAVEFQSVRECGCDYGQGYFLAMPSADPPTVPWPID
jgi:EAL domain-containing protein (putative c-di-GMP-specific phosphodiesterase class I)